MSDELERLERWSRRVLAGVLLALLLGAVLGAVVEAL